MSASRGRSVISAGRDRHTQPGLAGRPRAVAGIEPPSRDRGKSEASQRLGQERALAAQRVRDDAAVAVEEHRLEPRRGGRRTAAACQSSPPLHSRSVATKPGRPACRIAGQAAAQQVGVEPAALVESQKPAVEHDAVVHQPPGQLVGELAEARQRVSQALGLEPNQLAAVDPGERADARPPRLEQVARDRRTARRPPIGCIGDRRAGRRAAGARSRWGGRVALRARPAASGGLAPALPGRFDLVGLRLRSLLGLRRPSGPCRLRCWLGASSARPLGTRGCDRSLEGGHQVGDVRRLGSRLRLGLLARNLASR